MTRTDQVDSALSGAPESFRTFIKAQLRAQETRCEEVYVQALRTDGFAIGTVSSCGGGWEIWGTDGSGQWRTLTGTQNGWDCAELTKYKVPSELVDGKCTDYEKQSERDYNQP